MSGSGGVFSICVFYLTLTCVYSQTVAPSGTKDACTYSFVVPEPNLVATCKNYAAQQVDLLKKRVHDLEDQLTSISGGTASRNISHALNLQFQCGCNNNTQFGFTYRDCHDVKAIQNSRSGIYEIEPIKSTGQLIKIEHATQTSKDQRYWLTTTWGPIKVACDINDDVGWTVLMRRRQFNETFDRDWYAYKWGFGDKESGDFWLGLEYMYRITNQMVSRYTLWIELVDHLKIPHVFTYTTFKVDDEKSRYKLTISGFHGSSSNYMSGHNNMPFATKDKIPNRPGSSSSIRINCPNKFGPGGWWYKVPTSNYYYSSYCGQTNLNSKYPVWPNMRNISFVEMKIRPVD